MKVIMKQRLVPSIMRRKPIPISEMKKLQISSYIQLQLKDFFSSLVYRYNMKLPNFILLLGDSGFGKTGLMLQLAKSLNEMNGYKWDVERYVYLARDTLLTGAYIANKFKEGEWVIVDEFHLVASAQASSMEQTRDVNEFFNTIRNKKIGLIGVTQYLTDIHKSVHNKFGFMVYATYCDPIWTKMILARVEIKLLEEGGDWYIGWNEYQDIYCGFGDPKDHAFVENLKARATLTIEGVDSKYKHRKDFWILASKEEKSDVIARMYFDYELSQKQAIYCLLAIKQSKAYIRGRLKLRRSEYDEIYVQESKLAYQNENQIIPDFLQNVIRKFTQD